MSKTYAERIGMLHRPDGVVAAYKEHVNAAVARIVAEETAGLREKAEALILSCEIFDCHIHGRVFKAMKELKAALSPETP